MDESAEQTYQWRGEACIGRTQMLHKAMFVTCEFSTMPLGIFAEALKNGVDARFKDTEKERCDNIGQQKDDKAGN